MRPHRHNQHIWTLVLLMLLLVGLAGIAVHRNIAQRAVQTEIITLNEHAATTTTPTQPNPFSTLHLEAAAAYVFDIRTDTILYEHNADEPLPIASLTKLMTTLLAIETLDKTQPVFITLDALAQDGESGFFAFEQWRAQDLIDITLIASSNDGARALASAITSIAPDSEKIDTVTLMNRRAQELDLSQTRFFNETGLDIHNETSPGAIGSARDIAHMLVYITQNTPVLLESTRSDKAVFNSLNTVSHTFENTNTVANDLPWLIGSKTGFTDSAGGNLAVIFDAGLARPIVAVVLGSTVEGRFDDISQIASTTLAYLQTGK